MDVFLSLDSFKDNSWIEMVLANTRRDLRKRKSLSNSEQFMAEEEQEEKNG